MEVKMTIRRKRKTREEKTLVRELKGLRDEPELQQAFVKLHVI